MTPFARSSQMRLNSAPVREVRARKWVRQEEECELGSAARYDFHHLLIRHGKHPGHGMGRNSHAQSAANSSNRRCIRRSERKPKRERVCPRNTFAQAERFGTMVSS